MTDALEDHEGTISIGGRTITNLHFADDIIGLAGEEEELANLVECLDKAFTASGMEISAEKTKLMTNNTSGINTEIKVNGQRLETVTRFKYLGLVISDEGSKPEILSRIAQTTVALTRLKPVWTDMSISLSSKIRLMRSLITSIRSLIKTILQVKGGRRQGGQRKRWEDNMREWTGPEFGKSQSAVKNRGKWRKLVVKSFVVPQRPSQLRDR